MSQYKGTRVKFTLRLSPDLLQACRERMEADTGLVEATGDLNTFILLTLENAIGYRPTQKRKRHVA